MQLTVEVPGHGGVTFKMNELSCGHCAWILKTEISSVERMIKYFIVAA
jgi:copper chaperone CopZ